MKYIEQKGDLFELDPNIYVFAHCISADVTPFVGMGAGIAKSFRKKFPNMVKEISPFLEVGKSIRYQEGNVIIYNIVPKHYYYQKVNGNNSYSFYLKNLKNSLIDIRDQMIKNEEYRLAMPKIACGIDRGNWKIVSLMIQSIFKNTNIEILIRLL